MKGDFKKNWQETRERFVAWWKRKEMGRPLMVVTAPRSQFPTSHDGHEHEKNAVSMEEQWLNAEGVLQRKEVEFGRTAFLGEAFPYLWADLGPGSLGTFLGAKPVFEPDTVWYEPCFDRARDAVIRFQKDSPWWRWTMETTRLAVERARGRYLVTFPDLIENIDTLAAILGTEETLIYLIDAPDEIHRLQKELLPIWFEAYNALYDLIQDEEGWSSFAAFNIWGPGKTAKLQCDFSAMISPAMFDEFVLPYLQEQCDALDCTIYHLDGSHAIRHLDSLLSIDSLDCIQWTPGAGAPDGGDPCWDDIYRKSLDAGKCIHAHMPPHQVKDFVKRFGKTGVFIQTYAPSEEEGQRLINESFAW